MKTMKLKAIRKITGKIQVISGLHIGAGKDVIEIGGTDMPVIKDALTGLPYVPGSSLKGRMRALLEWQKELVETGEVCNDPKTPIGRVAKGSAPPGSPCTTPF